MSNHHIGKLPGARKEGDDWIVTINDQFQYGQKNSQGQSRWLVFHDEDNKIYQHRFLVNTMQSNAAPWAKTLATSLGGFDIAHGIPDLGSAFLGETLKSF
ncbi:hypothetical protein FZEAL_8301 [Fusarium zealandicum]|uniref:Uncharacterized protein n=1 Tax=Fusarium zealandicum TaxID=1053134 RepID=A0A8H4UEV5_9HYPO|nr:hypothetical protein FZEAL_8301 [Fusarium zealandicum]